MIDSKKSEFKYVVFAFFQDPDDTNFVWTVKPYSKEFSKIGLYHRLKNFEEVYSFFHSKGLLCPFEDEEQLVKPFQSVESKPLTFPDKVLRFVRTKYITLQECLAWLIIKSQIWQELVRQWVDKTLYTHEEVEEVDQIAQDRETSGLILDLMSSPNGIPTWSEQEQPKQRIITVRKYNSSDDYRRYADEFFKVNIEGTIYKTSGMPITSILPEVNTKIQNTPRQTKKKPQNLLTGAWKKLIKPSLIGALAFGIISQAVGTVQQFVNDTQGRQEVIQQEVRNLQAQVKKLEEEAKK